MSTSKWLLVDPKDGMAYEVANEQGKAEQNAPFWGCAVVKYVPADHLGNVLGWLEQIALGSELVGGMEREYTAAELRKIAEDALADLGRGPASRDQQEPTT